MTAPLSVARLPPRRRRRLGLVVLVLLFALFLLLSNLVPLAAEWLWFQALGYERVFTTRLVAEAVLGVAVGGAVFAFLYANLRIAQRGLVPNPLVVQVSGAAAVDVTRLLRRLALPTALGLALLFGMGAAGGWLGVLQFLRRTPFGATDPVFGREVGYYVFTLPVIAGAIGLGIAVTTLTLLATIVLYVVRRDIVVFRRQVTVEPSARLHLAVLIALLFVLLALRVYFVRLPGLLYSTTGPLVGASYADLHAQLTGLRLAGLAAVASGALVLWGARSHRLARNTLLAVGLYLGVSLLGVALYPATVQKLVVAPNELVKETPQLASHIAATRRAWGLDSVVTRDLTGEARLTERDIRANRPTIDNVRLWDRDPLLQTFGQLQEIRTYYDFVSVDDDRYWIDGQYRQVLLSPRELNSGSLPTRTFINERLTFTHGMGLTLGPVNQVTQERLPRDVRPEHPRAGAHGAAVPGVRRRPLPRRRRFGPAPLDPRRLHRDQPLPLRATAVRRHQLHAQQREGRDRRLRRHRHGLPGRPARPAGAHPGEGVPRDLPAARRDRSEERRVGKECRSRWSPYH